MAQQASDADLKALIPDSAVANPEGWAKAPQPSPLADPQPDSAASLPLPPPPPPPPRVTPGTPAPVGAVPLAPAAAGNAAYSAPAPLSQATAGIEGMIGPDSPLPELPGITLPWPDQQGDLPPLPVIAPETDAALVAGEIPALPDIASIDARQIDRLDSGRLVLVWPADASAIPERHVFEKRFRTLSSLQNLPGKEQTDIGQVAVRAAADRVLLEQMLKVYGYYDGDVLQSLRGADPAPAPAPDPAATPGAPAITTPAAIAAPRVRFTISPGARYRLGTVELPGLTSAGRDTAMLRRNFGLSPGDPLRSDAIVAASAHLGLTLGETGYAFAKIDPPVLTVDHERAVGNLDMPVTPGDKLNFGPITSLRNDFLSSRHLAEIARFKPGQLYKRSQTDDLRSAILATGLVSNVTITPRETLPQVADTPGTAAIDIAITPAPQHTVSGAVGYDTAEGFRLEASWENRNMFPPEGSLRLRGVAGTNEQLAGATFRRNNFHGRDRVLTFDLYADNATLTAYAARKVAFAATYERLTTLLFQKPFVFSLGVQAEASDEREGLASGITTGRTPYYTVALPARVAFDLSDSLLDPHHGWRASLMVSPEVSESRGSFHNYARIQGDASLYLPTIAGIVMALRARLGSIPGTALQNIAPSRRFYAGGGGSIRGYGYELVGPRNALNEPEGGRSLYELSAEARIKTGFFGGALSLAPFLDAGGADTGPVPGFKDLRYGAGMGFRFESGVGPIRLDIGTPLNRRPGDSIIGVYVSLGQSF